MLRTLILIFIVVQAACVQEPVAEDTAQQQPVYTECPETRPVTCTREYQPVCATRDSGIRCVKAPCPSTKKKTYANACNACVDQKVYGYVPGECAGGA